MTKEPADLHQGEESEFSEIAKVEELQNHGINAADIAKLQAAGICSVSSVLSTTRRNLLKIKGFSEVKVEKIKEAASKILTVGFVTASEHAEMRQRIVYISTGSTGFDAMLGGGISTMAVTEVYGEFRCGKTQLSHTLCVTSQLTRDCGGANGKVVFIDTEGTFRPDRITKIAERFGLDPEVVLDNIAYARALNSEHQMELIESMASNLSEGAYRLVIVDSVMAQFRVDYCGRGELSERQQKLNQMLGKLVRLAEEFNVAIFLTNQVQSDPSAMTLFAGGDGKKPIGGHVLAHASSTRVLLRKGRNDERVAKLQDSPEMPESECTYCISEGGITDVA